MNTNYDRDLMEIEFYGRFHPEYLPYVGDNYDESKVLLLGESNYVDADNLSEGEIQLIESSDWYTTDSRKLTYKGFVEWCHNREIISDTLQKKKDGKSTSPAHNMYINPAKAFGEVFPQVANSWDAFSYFASMNYFQKPATKTGKSIEPKLEDKHFAAANLCDVVSVLKPETIIFLSKKAFWAFKANEPVELKDFYIKACAHPTCAWWNRDDGKHGREAFRNIIKVRVSITL